MNAKDYAEVIRLISKELDISRPDNTLIRNVTSYIKQLDYAKLQQLYPSADARFSVIADYYIRSITTDEQQDFDYHSHLQSESLKNKTDDIAILNPLVKWSNDNIPIVSSKSMTVYLDSRARNISESSAVDFSFTLVPRQTRSELGDGRIQVRNMPSQVTFFKIGKIIIPYSSELRSCNFTKEMTLTFTALRANGIIAHNDTYHFSFTYAVINDKLVELTPVEKYCKFNPPLRLVDNMSIRFNDPIYPVQFSRDRMLPVSFNYQSTDGRIVFGSDHNLDDGDVIIIQGLRTDNDSANMSTLEMINNPRGVLITKINNTTIATGIDFTQFVSPDITSLPTILFYSRMFRFNLEIGHQDIPNLD